MLGKRTQIHRSTSMSQLRLPPQTRFLDDGPGLLPKQGSPVPPGYGHPFIKKQSSPVAAVVDNCHHGASIPPSNVTAAVPPSDALPEAEEVHAQEFLPKGSGRLLEHVEEPEEEDSDSSSEDDVGVADSASLRQQSIICTNHLNPPLVQTNQPNPAPAACMKNIEDALHVSLRMNPVHDESSSIAVINPGHDRSSLPPAVIAAAHSVTASSKYPGIISTENHTVLDASENLPKSSLKYPAVTCSTNRVVLDAPSNFASASLKYPGVVRSRDLDASASLKYPVGNSSSPKQPVSWKPVPHNVAFPQARRALASSPPEKQGPANLQICFNCKRRLQPGRDIYMYRGDVAFCTEECRMQQILWDERQEAMRAAAGSSSKKDNKSSINNSKSCSSRKAVPAVAA